MSDLKNNLYSILQEKCEKIIPENIKKDVEIFDVVGTLEGGTDTSDADATAEDILQNKTAYVNGEKITGSLYKYPDGFIATANHERTSVKLDYDPVMQTPSINISIQESSFIDTIAVDKWKGENIFVAYDTLANTIGLTADKIVEGNNILGIEGSVIELIGQEKTITPTTQEQIITPDTNYNAITKLTINPVTSSIDSNIVAENIKAGVTILGVTGTYTGG